MAERKQQFQVGDKVRIKWSPDPEKIGIVTTIVSPLRAIKVPTSSDWHGILPSGTLVHVLDIKAKRPNSVVAYPPKYLEPYYDGNEKGSWTDCVWKPNKILSH